MFQSLRYGFATNSSSSHSIIFTPEKPWTGGIRDAESFSLLSQEEKAIALLQCLPAPGRLSSHAAMSLQVALNKAGIDITPYLTQEFSNHVSLQGAMLSPPKEIDVNLWVSMIMDPQCSIHGYSDCLEAGVDKTHPLTALRSTSFTLLGNNYYNWRWKQDGQAIVGFNQETGMKFRWSADPYTKSAIPELVDVKITDWCGYGCSFCYQGSTTEGQHASYEHIEQTFKDLADWGVFEIALGGGEPLAHPRFADIMRLGRDLGLSVSFTTFSKSFDTEYPWLLKVLDEVDGWRTDRSEINGATGVSVHGHRDIERLAGLRDRLSSKQCYRTLCAQTVVGATPLRTLERTMDLCIYKGLWLLLLGYKTTGRGLGKDRPVCEKTLEKILLKAKKATEPGAWTEDGSTGFCLAVDTAFLDNHGALLDKLEVPVSLRSSPEGKFSMYVDAVAQTCGPSSYSPNAMKPQSDMRTLYRTW